MGSFMREYWIPALISSELPTPDCPPMRLRLLGENLIAFRDTVGKVGIFVNSCPHRGASMFFGRNEEEGLRCVYHGWKFDTSGTCVDMPSEPAESNFKAKVKIRAYPCIERNSIIWTYMGPREVPPPLPQHHINTMKECRASKSLRVCNYMQALEGDIDTVHTQFLHGGHVRIEEAEPGTPRYYQRRQPDAWLVTEHHEIGTTYGAWRRAEEDRDYWRIGHFQLPFYTSNANGTLTQKFDSHAWVPIDDENTMVWSIWAPLPEHLQGQNGIGGLRVDNRPRPGDNYGANRDTRGLQPDLMLPDTTDWLGKWRSIQTLENDYLIDREAQRTMRSYSGIPNGNEPQDRGVQESMGPIYDRTQEHLGTSDMMIIAARRRLISACRAFIEQGAAAPGVDKPELYWMFSGAALVPKDTNGIDFTRDVLFGRAPTVEIPVVQS
jgi:phenylpropionate dioxygenase-like ring-hydroxylating dioxygenase large terminal subunit